MPHHGAQNACMRQKRRPLPASRIHAAPARRSAPLRPSTAVFRTTMRKRSLQTAQQRVHPTLLAQPSTWARLFGFSSCHQPSWSRRPAARLTLALGAQPRSPLSDQSNGIRIRFVFVQPVGCYTNPIRICRRFVGWANRIRDTIQCRMIDESDSSNYMLGRKTLLFSLAWCYQHVAAIQQSCIR